MSSAICKDCGVNTLTDDQGEYGEYAYMVHNSLWMEAHGLAPINGFDEYWAAHGEIEGVSGFLCIGCIESRLGRQLNARDFTSAPINCVGMFNHSERLKERLSNHGV